MEEKGIFAALFFAVASPFAFSLDVVLLIVNYITMFFAILADPNSL